jgi:hypothetical protein
LPAGSRSPGGSFGVVGDYAYFWLASEDGADYTNYRNFCYGYANVRRNYGYKAYGFLLRCLED